MNELEQARERINRIDAQMLALFLERMDAVKSVSEYKIQHGLPTLDSAREAAVIEKNAMLVADPVMRKYYIEFLQGNMAVSRHYQENLKGKMKVAFSGVFGAFAHIAAEKIYGDAEPVACNDFKSAYDSVANGDCDVAVLPIENSTAGEIGSVLDLLFSGQLYITGVYDLFIHQHLMAKKGTSIGEIEKVISHPQALAQCAFYLREKGFAQQEFDNTAAAAKYVAESDERNIAAIASEETAVLYGLEILARNINERNMNTTRFAVVSKARAEQPEDKKRHTILMFTVADRAGAFSEAISIIGKNGYNMRCLRSRPMKELMWKYYFYAEIEDNLDTEKGKAMLHELSGCCDKIRNFGSFPFPAELH